MTVDGSNAHLMALRASVDRLRGLVTSLDDDRLEMPAYPRDWDISDVLSHIGSGAVILQRRLEDALSGQTMPDDFAPAVWDVWNAKSPRAKADDALTADGALVDRLGSLSDAERAGLRVSMGPLALGFTELVAIRLNEHAFHSWDIQVVLDPGARIPEDAAALVVDNLELVARYTAKPTGTTRSITVGTTAPSRRFTVDLSADAVSFASTDRDATADLMLPAEAFARLVYGRLDPEHTPPVEGDATALVELRPVFPGP